MVLIDIPLIVGLVAVGLALLVRAYKTFLEAQKVDPKLKFDHVYLINAIVAGGFVVTIITAVLPELIKQIANTPSVELTLGSLVLNFIVGFALTYVALDGLNKGTSAKIEIAELKENE